jgi:hypothetical protein
MCRFFGSGLRDLLQQIGVSVERGLDNGFDAGTVERAMFRRFESSRFRQV